MNLKKFNNQIHQEPLTQRKWILVTMLDGGCEALYIARRVVRMASEDIGNADPRAPTISWNEVALDEEFDAAVCQGPTNDLGQKIHPNFAAACDRPMAFQLLFLG